MQTSLGEKITVADVQRVMEQFSPLQITEATSITKPEGLQVDLNQPLREARDAFERLYFEHHIQKADKNMSRVAEAVELERTHLYRKLKQLGIKTK
jgi:DNA-binding NtrC family response regulator